MERRKEIIPGVYVHAPESERCAPERYFEFLAPLVPAIVKELCRTRLVITRVGGLAAVWKEVPLDGVDGPFLTIDRAPGRWYLALDPAAPAAPRSKPWRHETTGRRLAPGTNPRVERRLARRRAG